MKIETIPVGLLEAHCYLVYDESRDDCVLIDPGAEAGRIRKAVGARRIDAILLTHGHFDHIGAVRELMGEDTRLYIHLLDAPMLADGHLNAGRSLLGVDVTAPPATDYVAEGDIVRAAGLSFLVLHTPGHTPGGVCYLTEGHLFSGDTLFEHGWGRTDLPGGDQHALFASLRRLMPLAQTLVLHPGHHA